MVWKLFDIIHSDGLDQILITQHYYWREKFVKTDVFRFGIQLISLDSEIQQDDLSSGERSLVSRQRRRRNVHDSMLFEQIVIPRGK